MSATFKTVLARSDGADTCVEVTFSVLPGSPGSRGPFGEPMEPDEPESVEIESVTDEGMNSVELTIAEHEHLEACCYEQIRNARRTADEDLAYERHLYRQMFGNAADEPRLE